MSQEERKQLRIQGVSKSVHEGLREVSKQTGLSITTLVKSKLPAVIASYKKDSTQGFE